MRENKKPIIVLSAVLVLIIGGTSLFVYRRGRKPAQKKKSEREQAMQRRTRRYADKDLSGEAEILQNAFDKRLRLVRCFDLLEKSRNTALNTYYSWFRPTVTDRSGEYLHIHGVDQCESLIKRVPPRQKKIQVLVDLKKALKSYITGVKGIKDVLEKMRGYEKTTGGREGKYPKGSTLHFELMNVVGAVNLNGRRIRCLSGQSAVELGERRLDYYLSKYGEKTRAIIAKTDLETVRFISLVNKKNATHQELQTSLTELNRAINRLKGHISNGEQEIKDKLFDGDSTQPAALKRFLRGCSDIVRLGGLYIRGLKAASGRDPEARERFIRRAFSKGPGPRRKILKVYEQKVAGAGSQIPW